MLDAVARRKAHRLFDRDSGNLFHGAYRPQEDLITSAVFGSIRLMSASQKLHALSLVLGDEPLNAAGFSADTELSIDLWKSLRGLKGKRSVQPDVIVFSGQNCIIVEVKWHAPLSENQLELQLAAAQENGYQVAAMVMLGEPGVTERLGGIPCFRRTWRDVSADTQRWSRRISQVSEDSAWAATIRDFLAQTDMGRIFSGLDGGLAECGGAAYCFSRLHLNATDLRTISQIHYTYEVTT